METLSHENELEICPIIYSLKIVSRKWVLPILCELNKKKSLRYSELKRQINGVTNMALTQALKELIEHGLIHREQFNEIPPHTEYSLTEEGAALLPSLYSLAKWGMIQMEQSDRECSCLERCYASHYEYLPTDREPEILKYPSSYNEKYEKYFTKIEQMADDNNKDILFKIEHFLLAMIRILTEDGEDETRWTMTYYFRKDTPDILQHERPQYKILRHLFNEGQTSGIITQELDFVYFADEFSKIITGMVSEWLMSKCSYDIIEHNRPMIHWLCQSLSQRNTP